MPNWTGPILLRSADYLKGLQQLLDRAQRRVVHNTVLIMFALDILPVGKPDALVCARATMWAMPEAASSLYASQFDEASVRDAIGRVMVFIFWLAMFTTDILYNITDRLKSFSRF